MDLRQLEYFVAVAEEGGFTRAAERVHISQSGVSAQIKQLERELGATLIDRSTRRARLTTAGKAALGHARAALAAAEAVRQAVAEVNDVIRGRLVVGMVTACTVQPLFDGLARFHRAHPGVELSLVEDTSDRLLDGIRAGAVDVALVGVAGELPAGLDAVPLAHERLIACTPPDHPLARRTRVRLASVADHRVVCLPPGTGIRTAFDRACAATGVTPRVALEASAPDAVADLARRGLGVAILSESMADPADPRLVARPIADADVPALLALVWPVVAGPALRAALVHLRAAFGTDGPADDPAPAAASV